MKIKMKMQLTGTRNGERWPAVGEVKTLPDGEAAELCASGLAEPVAEKRAEKAVAPKAEKRG